MDYPFVILRKNTTFQMSPLFQSSHNVKEEITAMKRDLKLICDHPTLRFVKSFLLSFFIIIPFKLFSTINIFPLFLSILLFVFIGSSILFYILQKRIKMQNQIQESIQTKIHRVFSKALFTRLFQVSELSQANFAPYIHKKNLKKKLPLSNKIIKILE